MDLGKFLNENLESNEQLDEGLKEIASGLANKIKLVYKAVKSTVVNISGKIFGIFKKGGESGITDSAGIERVHISEQSNGGMTCYGIGFTNGTKISSSKNESFFKELSSELFESDPMNISPEAGDMNADDEMKKDKSDAMQQMFGLGGQLKGVKIDQGYKKSYEGRPEGTITVDELKSLFGRLAFQVKFRTRQTQFIPSILIFGSPGEAKTAIGRQVAKIIGSRYKSIEVASIYTEIFGGMPVSQTVLSPETGREKSMGEDITTRKIGNMLFEGSGKKLGRAWKKYGFLQKVLTGDEKAVEELKSSPENSALLALQAVYLKRALTGVWDESYIKTKTALQNMGYGFQSEKSAKNEGREYIGVEDARYITEADGQKVSQKTKTIVELVPVKGVLPDPGNKDPWLLTLDEFSRTDKKMSAVMNLLLTGAIGTIYFLPLKTIVAATSNLGGKGGSDDSDGEDVAKITGAILTRFSFVVKVQGKINDTVKYIMGSFTKLPSDREDPDFDPTSDKEEWELKPENFDLDPELAAKWDKMIPPALWLNYHIRNGLEQGQYFRQDLQSFQAGTPVKLNPRVIDRVSQNIAFAALQDWESGHLVTPVGKSKAPTKEWYEQNYDKEKVPIYNYKEDKWASKTLPSPQAFYLLMNQGNKRYLNIIRASLEQGEKELLADIEAAHGKTQKEMVLGNTESILTQYGFTIVSYNKDVEKLAELELVARSAKNIVIDEIPRKLVEFKNIEGYKNKIKDIDWKKLGFKTEYFYLAANIVRFTDDAMCSGDEIAGLGIAIGQAIADTENKETAEFLSTLASVLSDDEAYKAVFTKLDDIDLKNVDFNATDNDDDDDDLFKTKSIVKEEKEREDGMEKQFERGFIIFIKAQLSQIKKMGRFEEFKKISEKFDGTRIKQLLMGLWTAVTEGWLIPDEVKKPRKNDMKEHQIVERGLKNLFESLRR